MTPLRIELLGGVAFRLASGANLTLPTRKSRLLLAYLALAQGRAQPRAKLMSLLWGDRSEPQARGSLRQELHALRQSLLGVDPPPLQIAGDSVALDPRAATVDAVVFEELAGRGEEEALKRAAALYRGDLLEGVPATDPAFEEWLSIERQRLRDVAVAALGKLLALETERGAFEVAMVTGRRLLALDPVHEETHRALMRLLARQGQRNAALRQYQLCRAALARELGVEPDEATERLHRDLLVRCPPKDGAEQLLTGAVAPLKPGDGPVQRAWLARDAVEAPSTGGTGYGPIQVNPGSPIGLEAEPRQLLRKLEVDDGRVAPEPGRQPAPAWNAAPGTERVARFLEELGLAGYLPAFRANHVDDAILFTLTDHDLRAIGVEAVGHRKCLLQAIARVARGGQEAMQPTDRDVTMSAAERRQLTVIFVDLVGSTALATRLDPEELREVLGTYQRAVTKAVTRFEGCVAHCLGEGVLAYFGWPRAHEDGAAQAVRAGLAVTRAVGELGAAQGEPLACRVGIATGLVVVGDLADGLAREGSVIGETPNLAARLQGVAGPGQVVMAATTRRLVGNLFELADLGVRPLKGLAAGVHCWAVVREVPPAGRFEALHAHGINELIGREQELALLVDRGRLARAGDGQVVVLAGEAGIGKSRLVLALRERLLSERWVGVRLQCSSRHAHSALWPVIGHLEHAAGLERDAPAEVRRGRLAALLTPLAPAAEAEMPLLAELLGIPEDESHPLLSLAPQQKKRRIFDALLGYIEALARRQPVLVILEDAQWLDPTTRELFDAIVESVARLPVLLVVAARPDALPLWAGHAHVTALTLNRLVGRQVEALVELVTGGRALPAQAVEQIRARTDGVPLFIEELTKAVIEAGLVRDVGDRLELAGPLPPLAIPTTLHNSLMARLDRLSVVKEVVQTAACIGRRFSHDLLAAAAALPEGQLLAALDQLVAAQIVFRRGTPPEAVYTFKHSLVQDAAYQSMLKGRRQQLHAAVARALEQRFPAEADAAPEIVAHHFTEAGLADLAVDWWLKAGELAAGRSAMAEATATLRRALDLLARLPRTEEHVRRELLAQATLGRVLITTHGQAAPETGRAFDAALALADQLGETEEVLGVLAGIFVYRMVRADLADALAVAGRMQAVALAGGGDVATLMAHRCVGVVRFYLGDHLEACHSLERAVELYRDGEHAPLARRFAFDPKAAALGYLGICLVVLGRTAEAEQRFAEALAHAQALGHLVTWANTLAHVGLGRMVAGDEAGVRAVADALGPIAAEQGFPYWTAHTAIQRGWLLLGDRAGSPHFREGIAIYRASGARMAVPMLLAMQAAAHLRHGEAESAGALLEEARSLAAETGERWCEPEIMRLAGEVLAARGKCVEGELELRQALELAERQGARLWHQRAQASIELMRRGWQPVERAG